MSKIPKVVPFTRSAAYLHHRAMMNRRDNHHVDALELMRRAVEAQPDNSEYRLDLAELYCEMGLHQQSSRLLLDMLSENDAPSECFYGLALNQLGMNDIDGARQSLNIYRNQDPEGPHFEDVSRLAEELDYYSVANRPASRRLNRALCVANRACDAMRAGDIPKAERLFEKTLKMSSEQYEMRALYALTLVMNDKRDEALKEAKRASNGYPPSCRALCVAAQVYHLLGDDGEAVKLLDAAAGEYPAGQELRLLLYSAGEIGLHERAAEYARLALQETPYDRELLHNRAVGLAKSGSIDEAARCWERILRLDPEDSVAQYHSQAAEAGELNPEDLDYAYEVPREEYNRRMLDLSSALSEGYETVCQRWHDEANFRRLVRWAATTDDTRLGRLSMTVLSTVEEDDAKSVLRELMFAPEVSKDLKLHAAVLLRLQNRSLSEILPKPMDAMGEALVDSEELLSKMPVGDRQLVRYADEVLEREYGISARPVLALMWQSYRQLRGTKGDPLKRVDAAAAALACGYLMAAGQKPDLGKLAKLFGCPTRQLVFYATRLADRLDRTDKG